MVTLKMDNIRFFGGPYDKQQASMSYIPDMVFFHDGSELAVYAYAKVEEKTYVYSTLSSLHLQRTEDGRAAFLKCCISLPDYGTEWKKSDEAT